MQIDSNTHTTSVQGNYRVESKPLTDAEAKAKAQEVQNQNLQLIEDGLEQNPTGRGDKVKIKVPADSSGQPIPNPTAKDWEEAARNNQFVEVENTPSILAYKYYGLSLVDFGVASENLTANKALLKELRDASGGGIIFPSHEPIPTSEMGDIVRAYQARQRALRQIESGIGYPNQGMMNPPRERVEMKVPADADGKPIKNPTTQDWIDAQKNNKWATVSGKPDDLAKDYFGVNIDTGKWRESHADNKTAINEASQHGKDQFAAKIRVANGDKYIDIPDAGKIMAEVMAVLGPAYQTEMSKASELKDQMDSLKKKNEALNELEKSISDKKTNGDELVDFEVPTKRYVYDKDGNKVMDEKGKPKTEDIKPPPTNEDWARAAEFKKISQIEGKTLNGRDAAEKYLNIKLSRLAGGNDADHRTNLANNLSKIGNERTAVNSEMSKLSGQFDFRMGNAQTNLQNANKIIANMNDMILSIARAI